MFEKYFDYHKEYKLKKPRELYSEGKIGLQNLGNTCYINSILQCLSHTIMLADYVMTLPTIHSSHEYGKINLLFIEIFEKMWCDKTVISPYRMHRLIKTNNQYNNTNQHDSCELLIYLLSLLHKSIKYKVNMSITGNSKDTSDELRIKSMKSFIKYFNNDYSFIVERFYGMTMTVLKCNCKDTRVKFEPFNILMLNVNESSNLNDLIKSQYKNEHFKCDECNNNGIKNDQLWDLPDVLMINLKRFDNNNVKNTTMIDYPSTLDLTDIISKERKDNNNYLYSLYAINCHVGSSDNGHYYSICTNLDHEWHAYDDGNVTRIHKLNEFKIVTSDAYILFYYRMQIK